MLRFFKSRQGFSLVEAMVTVAIFSFIMAGIYSITSVGENAWLTNNVRIELQQDLRKGMESMINDLRETNPSILDPFVPADGKAYDSITFQVPSGVSAGSIAWDATTIQFAKGGVGSKQLLRTSGATTKVLTQNLQLLEFRRQLATPDILEVSMQAQKNTPHGISITHNLDFNIQLRN